MQYPTRQALEKSVSAHHPSLQLIIRKTIGCLCHCHLEKSTSTDGTNIRNLKLFSRAISMQSCLSQEGWTGLPYKTMFIGQRGCSRIIPGTLKPVPSYNLLWFCRAPNPWNRSLTPAIKSRLSKWQCKALSDWAQRYFLLILKKVSEKFLLAKWVGRRI